jgi:hypothetical protein
MTSINISELNNTIVVSEDSTSTVVSTPTTSVVTISTEGPQGNAAPGIPTFIQTSQPTSTELQSFTKYAWWDTSGGDLTLWIEDGIP